MLMLIITAPTATIFCSIGTSVSPTYQLPYVPELYIQAKAATLRVLSSIKSCKPLVSLVTHNSISPPGRLNDQA